MIFSHLLPVSKITLLEDDFSDVDWFNYMWTEYAQNGNMTCGLYDDYLRFITTGVDTANDSYLLDSLFRLIGDFDIQVDFDITNTVRTGNNSWEQYFWVISDDVDWFNIRIQWDETTLEYHGRGAVALVTANTTGKFRITRSGTTMSSYWWNGAAWTLFGDSFTMDSSNVLVNFEVYGDNNTPGIITDLRYDNFTAIADSITLP